MNHQTQYDVVTLGETMLRLTPESQLRLEQAERLQVHVGGSESNTAVGLSRLGKRVAWLSRMTDNHLGRKIERAIAAHGVDTNHITWTSQDRVGLYFLEEGSPPRNSQVIYDRKGSAFSRWETSDLPSDLFVPNKSKWLHVTGISLWLGETTRATVAEAVRLAKLAGWSIASDSSACVYQAIEPVSPMGRLGGGDAFSAGFLSAWLESQDLQRSLKWATAARLKYSIPGDLPLISRAEVESLVDGASQKSLIR